MKSITWRSLLDVARKIAWAIFLVCLPVTSFPHLPSVMGGSALVRPLAIYPLLVLIGLIVIPYLIHKPIPTTILTVLPFVLAIVASSCLALLSGIQELQGVSLVSRLARALLTLGLGVAMYVAVSLYPRKPGDLKFTLQWLYVGFTIALVFGTLQAVYVIHFSPKYFQWLSAIQRYISIRRLFTNRISGMTYEPNWFGEQISFLLMPWLLAAVLTGYSTFQWRPLKRWRWLTVEWLLLGWASVILVFTFSRAGLIVFLALAFIGLVFLRARRPRPVITPKVSRGTWTRRVLEATLGLVVLISMIYLIGARSPFFSRIWDYWLQGRKETSLSGYFEYLGFGARFVYSETAYRIYLENPWLGVGLGNYVFYFERMMPDQPIAEMPEVLRLLTPEPGQDRLITPKNLYMRILSESGLLGMATFLGFILAVSGCAFYLFLAADSEQKYWGVAGILGMLAFLLSAASFDSFAIPNMWVVLGITTAAAWCFRRAAAGVDQLKNG